uniref:Uncharacterized protein n=1 Tax=Arundo donax TaxID=35708 RepID=A0A0A9CH22_ARUDO
MVLTFKLAETCLKLYGTVFKL